MPLARLTAMKAPTGAFFMLAIRRDNCAGIRHRLKSGRPFGPGKDGADAPSLSLRLRFLSPERCLTVFSLCFLLLSVLLLCCGCFSGLQTLKIKSINSLMAPSGSPALPGRRAPLR